MLASFRTIVDASAAVGRAAGAFTCYDATTASGVVAAAEARDVPVILLVPPGALRRAGARDLLAALRAVAEAADVPVCLQLDHASDAAMIAAALDAGVGAVMADGSQLPFADNVALVRAVARRAAEHGAEVEGELGHVAGDEDVANAATRPGALTDPEEARRFVSETGVACLAVSIGNVHGAYRAPPQLDDPLLRRIRAAVPVTLALHGASGLPAEQVRRSIASGVAKVNVNTEIRERQFDVLQERLPALADGVRVLELQDALRSAAAEVVAAKLDLFDPGRGQA